MSAGQGGPEQAAERCGWCHQSMDSRPTFDCKNPMHSGMSIPPGLPTADAGGAGLTDAEAVEALADATFEALDRQHDEARHIHASECCWPFAGVSAALRQGVSTARASTAQDEGAGEVERLRAAVEVLLDVWAKRQLWRSSGTLPDELAAMSVLAEVYAADLRAVVDRAKDGA